jgi:hypothetical protein
MTKHDDIAAEPDLKTLLGTLLRDSENLLRQQLELFKSEVRQQAGRVGAAGLCLGAGAGLVAAGGLLSTAMLVHLLHRQTRLPLWACYGLVAGGAAAAGAGLLARGRRLAAGLHFELPQTVRGVQENVTWLKDHLTPTP